MQSIAGRGSGNATYNVSPAPPTRTVDDRDIIDLGDRVFDVMHLPGHSPGSIALWEAASGTLCSGDAVYHGELRDDVFHSNIAGYVRGLERMRLLSVQVVRGGTLPARVVRG